MAIGKKDEAAALLTYIASLKEEDGDMQTAAKWNEEALNLLTPGSKMYERIAHYSTLNKMELFIKAKADSTYDNADKEQIRDYLKKLDPFLQSYLKQEGQYLQNDIEYYGTLSKAYEKVDSFKQSLYLLNKSVFIKDSIFGLEKMKSFSDLEAKISMDKERTKLLYEEESKRLELQKQAEIKALKVEFEQKQALPKTEQDRKRLLFQLAKDNFSFEPRGIVQVKGKGGIKMYFVDTTI